MVAVWMVCVLITALSVVAFEGKGSSDLVFCPLQKQWVKRSAPAKPKISLADICSSDKEKTHFFNRLILNSGIAYADKSSPEDLFFAFQAKGDQALKEIPSSPDFPERKLTSLIKVQTGSRISQTVLVAVVTQVLSFEQFSRPPTENLSANFTSRRVSDIDNISPSIAPRAPPVSL